jgi:hypothetical protein
MIRCVLICAVLFAPSAPASAAIFKWVDEAGTTVYSNVPPDDAQLAKQAKVVVPDEKPSPAREAAAREARERDLAERVARLERELAAQQQLAAQAPAAPPVQFVPVPVAAPMQDYSGWTPGFGTPFFPGAVFIRPAPVFFHKAPVFFRPAPLFFARPGSRAFVRSAGGGFHHSRR